MDNINKPNTNICIVGNGGSGIVRGIIDMYKTLLKVSEMNSGIFPLDNEIFTFDNFSVEKIPSEQISQYINDMDFSLLYPTSMPTYGISYRTRRGIRHRRRTDRRFNRIRKYKRRRYRLGY